MKLAKIMIIAALFSGLNAFADVTAAVGEQGATCKDMAGAASRDTNPKTALNDVPAQTNTPANPQSAQSNH
jgi:hypothetical protein